MTRTRLLLLLAIIATAALWSVGWSRNSGHLFGDPLLAREMFAAGDRLAADPLSTAGLPVYRPGAAPYTHLTPGPEWIQAAIAPLRLPFVSTFLWHSIITAALSLVVLLWIQRSTRGLLEAQGVNHAQGAAWAATVLVGSTPAFLIYAPHPYCLGTLLGNAIALAFVRSWARDPVVSRERRTMVQAGLAFAALFWLGTAPLVSGSVWMFAGLVRFGEKVGRRRRVLALIFTAAAVGLLCLALKLAQSVAVLGSWKGAVADARTILARRAGPGQVTGLLQDTVLFRLAFLFGLALVLLVVLAWRMRRELASQWELPLAFLAGGVAWQIVMRGHAAYHIYMLRDLIVPIVLTLALLAGQRDEDRQLRWIDLTAFAELLLVLGILVIPLVTTGEPLWRLLR